MPKCPRGCQSEKVVRDGVQRMGGRERQRYRCVRTNGDFHRFVGEGALSRTRGDGHSCGECHDGQDWRAVTTVASGQTVADWLSKFGSVVAAPHAEEAWPEPVVLDSTRFLYKDARTGATSQLFCVLAAWGYPAGATKGRLWRLRAYPLQDAATWEKRPGGAARPSLPRGR